VNGDINIPLIRNKVAIYLAQEYNSVGFQRKPSYDITRRQYATITIDPFKIIRQRSPRTPILQRCRRRREYVAARGFDHSVARRRQAGDEPGYPDDNRSGDRQGAGTLYQFDHQPQLCHRQSHGRALGPPPTIMPFISLASVRLRITLPMRLIPLASFSGVSSRRKPSHLSSAA